MPGLLYAVNVGTLAVWTTIAGAGLVGLGSMGDPGPPAREQRELDPNAKDGDALLEMQPESGSPEPGPPDDSQSDDTQEPEPVTAVTPPPDLPSMPPLETMPILPAVPDLPPQPVKAPSAVAETPKPTVRPAATPGRNSGGTGQPSNQSGVGTGSGNGKGTGTGNGNAPGNNKGGGGEERLRKGHFVEPVYPPDCEKAGQTGVVVILFTVDASGKVTSARVAKPSPYPQMDQAAVNVAYRWTFPPGPGVASGKKPVSFQINH